MVGRPTPAPTAMAMMSAVSRPVLEEVEGVELVPTLEVAVLALVLLSVMLLPLCELALVSVGFEALDVVVAEPPLPPPVATAASADTTAVVVEDGCGLLSGGSQENITDLATKSVGASASTTQSSEVSEWETLTGTPQAVSS